MADNLLVSKDSSGVIDGTGKFDNIELQASKPLISTSSSGASIELEPANNYVNVYAGGQRYLFSSSEFRVSTADNNTIDLGLSTARFKDIFCTGVDVGTVGDIFNGSGEEINFGTSDIRIAISDAQRFRFRYNRFVPLSTSYDLGQSSERWNRLYTVNGVNTSSSMDVKKEIEPEVKGLEFIKKLNPVSFKYNQQSEEENPSRGFIAQEIEKIDCEFCEKNVLENGEYDYGINYANFISPLVKAVQQLSEEVEILKKKRV